MMLTLIVLTILICSFILTTWIITGAVLIAYRSTHPYRRSPATSPASFGADYETVRFPSRDGVLLAGWLIKPRPRLAGEDVAEGVIVLCHGMAGNRDEVLHWAEALWKRGFGLLMFDFRSLGESEGERSTGGLHEAEDLRGAVDFVTSCPELRDLPLGVFGYSMGGAAAIMAAAEETRIRAVATHGTYATLDRAILQRCRYHFGPLAPVANWLTKKIAGWTGWFPYSTQRVSPVSVVSQLNPRPLLLLHGEQDHLVLAHDAQALYSAAASPKSLLMLPQSGHRTIHPPISTETRMQLSEFFQAALAMQRV